MTDFLLELLSEEIPARMQAKAAKDLAFLLDAALVQAGLPACDTEAFATPRRLAVIVRGLPLQTDPLSDEIKGPRTSAPAQALEGFLRKTGLTRDALTERDGVWFATVNTPGRETAAVIAQAVPGVIRGFPWPKSMRWGAASASTASLRWVRPLKGIVALLGEEIVPFEVDGIVSGAATVGHRFRHPGIITIGSAEDYAAKLRACHVILDPAERMAIIRDGAAAAAAAAGLTVVPDEGLVAENAGLTEWPVPLLGRFDPAFLEVPREVIQLTMRTNQKYFACVVPPRNGEGDRPAQPGGGGGSLPGGARVESPLHQPSAGPPPRAGEDLLAPAFICTANIDAADGGAAIVAGNGKVLAARLSDARFFWEQDLRVPLGEQAKKLDQIVFHEKLGTVADKVARVAKLARWLVEEGIISSPERGGGPPAQPVVEGGLPQALRSEESPLHQPAAGPPPRAGEDLTRATLAHMAEQAALLCKADLVTGMVGEFPELQGVMGGYYARAEGLPDEVADAIRDHYKPVGQGDEVPTAPVTVAVSLADKLDTLVAFFVIDLPPTGSKDPFALRRAALSALQLIHRNELRASLTTIVQNHASCLNEEDRRLSREQMRASLQKLGARVPEKMAFYESQGLFEPTKKGFKLSVAVAVELLDFFADRLKVQQREAGVRHDLIDAVFALGGEDDIVRLLARVKALQAFVETGEGRDLLGGYKRAANILKREGWGGSEGESLGAAPLPSAAFGGSLPLPASGERAGAAPAEAALVAALDAAEPRAAQAVEREDFAEAMRALATLRGPIDRFFEEVTVNDADPAVRAGRLDLLARIRAAVHTVADFSRIEG